MGTFAQTGGTNTVGSNFTLGGYSGNGITGVSGSGTYTLGRGLLNAYNANESVGDDGPGSFTQTGGTNTVSELDVGFGTCNGAYNLSGSGHLTAFNEYIGYAGSGAFNQGGGTNSIGSQFYIGNYSGDSGTYGLSGGLLTAIDENVGNYGVGMFAQSGGTNAISLLSISGSSSYFLGGGLLQVNGSVVNEGLFSGGTAAATLTASGLLNLTSGTWQNLGKLSVSLTANSLLIVPAGFNPFDGIRTLHQLGVDPYCGQHAYGAGRLRLRRLGVDQRSGCMPGNDHCALRWST